MLLLIQALPTFIAFLRTANGCNNLWLVVTEIINFLITYLDFDNYESEDTFLFVLNCVKRADQPTNFPDWLLYTWMQKLLCEETCPSYKPFVEFWKPQKAGLNKHTGK